jgi:hypothetical protein
LRRTTPRSRATPRRYISLYHSQPHARRHGSGSTRRRARPAHYLIKSQLELACGLSHENRPPSVAPSRRRVVVVVVAHLSTAGLCHPASTVAWRALCRLDARAARHTVRRLGRCDAAFARTMGFFATSAAFALLEGMFYAYVQSSTPRERRSYVCARAATRAFESM